MMNKKIEKLNLDNLNLRDLDEKINTASLQDTSFADWRKRLGVECQCYVCGENYLCKRFDQINYSFCSKESAEEIVEDNLYALLRYKYFTRINNDIDDLIGKIVKSFLSNLKTSLIKVSLEDNSECKKLNTLQNYQCAFRNGVYDFKENKWLFKYDITEIEDLNNKIYSYDSNYCILWYINIVFDDLGISINNTKEVIDILKELDTIKPNYCYRLVHNMCFDRANKFSEQRLEHLCEIMGYLLLRDFSQNFVILIGSGQNGKNSLFDGCISPFLLPRPSSNDLESIENDRFITGSLENKYQNIFLESSAKTYRDSKMIKALTGSPYQTIEQKGINKYSGYINCKFLFAGNDQDKIKFSDMTEGFKRRINIMDIWYKWDNDNNYLKKGNYYDVRFSDDLKEIKEDVINTITFVYLAYLGIRIATNNFTKSFKFTYNDYNKKYADYDIDLKDKIESVTTLDIYRFMSNNDIDGRTLFYDKDSNRLSNSETLKTVGILDKSVIRLFRDEELITSYCSEYDLYINVRSLQKIVKDVEESAASFSSKLKRIYDIGDFKYLYNNRPYVKVRFVRNKLKVVM